MHEALSAVVAREITLARMRHLMSLLVMWQRKALAALATLIFTPFSIHLLSSHSTKVLAMRIEIAAISKTLPAVVACEWTLVRMCHLMAFQVMLAPKALAAVVAGEWTLNSMSHLMVL